RRQVSARRTIGLVRIQCVLCIFDSTVGSVEKRSYFSEIVRSEEPISVINACQRKEAKGRNVDLAPLIIDRLAVSGIAERLRTPSSDDFFRAIRVFAKTKSHDNL